MNLEVNQFILTAISPDVLQAEDKETPANLIIFNVTKILGTYLLSITSLCQPIVI